MTTATITEASIQQELKGSETCRLERVETGYHRNPVRWDVYVGTHTKAAASFTLRRDAKTYMAKRADSDTQREHKKIRQAKRKAGLVSAFRPSPAARSIASSLSPCGK